MAFYALVVGITKYDTSSNLPKAAVDAEAIARVLEQHGDFYKVDRLPRRWVAEQNRYEVAPDKRVAADELFNALKTLLQEAKNNEVLIYFAGHGFRVTSRAGKQGVSVVMGPFFALRLKCLRRGASSTFLMG